MALAPTAAARKAKLARMRADQGRVFQEASAAQRQRKKDRKAKAKVTNAKITKGVKKVEGHMLKRGRTAGRVMNALTFGIGEKLGRKVAGKKGSGKAQKDSKGNVYNF